MLLKIVSFGMRYSAVSFPYLSTTILLCFIATEEKPKINCQVVIEQLPASCGDASLPSNQPTYAIGTIIVPTDTSWQQLEESLSNVVLTHFSDVATGLRTRRLGKVESGETDGPPLLGLSMNSVKYFSIGEYPA